MVKPRSDVTRTNRRLHGALVVVGIVILFGVLGYRILEKWTWLESFYMTIITISTVGFTEVRTLSPLARIFTIVLILGGVGSIALLGSNFVEWVIEQQAGRAGWRKKMEKHISSLKDHIIVCGYGRTGRYVVKQLAPAHAAFVVVERDPDLCSGLEEAGVLVVRGDASEEGILEEAGIGRADALVAALNTDADNLYLTLTAHAMNPDLRILVRAEELASHAKFLRSGAYKVISPYQIGADHIVQLLLRPHVVDFIDLVSHQENLELDIDQKEVDPNSELANKSIVESRVRQSMGRMILAIKKNDGSTVFDPAPETILRGGDVLVTIGRGTTGESGE